jgi:hypothetical protein
MYHRVLLRPNFFLHPEAGTGTGTGTQTGFIPTLTDAELQQKIHTIINKSNGDQSQAIGILLTDNAELREKNRQANARIQEVGKPKEGTVVLEGDEAKAVLDLRKKNVDFKTLPTVAAEYAELKEFKATQDRSQLNERAAKALGWDTTILADQLKLRNLHVEMRDETIKNGDKMEVKSMPYVRPLDNEKAPLEALGSYAEKNFPKPYFELLKATKGEESSGDDGTGTEFIAQSTSEQGSGAGNKKDATKSYLDANYTAPLPFVPVKSS